MVDANSSDGTSGASREQEGVLLNLPRTRPQRSSARRAASRARNGSEGPAGKPSKARVAIELPADAPAGKAASTARGKRRAPAKQHELAKRRAAAHRRSSTSPEDEAPRQGFESEAEAPSGSVQPPGAPELVASAAEILGELAKAGLSMGERLLKDAFSHLPLS